jgi:hypothetical protein
LTSREELYNLTLQLGYSLASLQTPDDCIETRERIGIHLIISSIWQT